MKVKKCVTVSYGRVKGKASQYQYFEPCIYQQHQTKDGRKLWKLDRNCGGARRSLKLAEKDALELASDYNIPFLRGIRQWSKINE